ncbi:PREDICTED: DNA-directed RNA polymerase III subunit rpc31-like [Camelina sativa]|uniref:DNA-directed RNA polymerase III subunit rpc31-like n=1 Tax=Camelina sativa TaxID=90675 RepID=A0ABM0YYM1_CAMSA|nr:PREDICTED: DNA-directed RNA polymerase III subunit rpc31-like [Camelina sativa]
MSRIYGVPFVIYPEITLPDPKSISIDSELVSSYLDFNKFWRNSTYHLGDDGVPKTEVESLDMERFYYSDTLKPKKKSKSSFYDYLLLRPDNFPKELLGDTPRQRPVKRAKWRQDLQKLDVFEELEVRYLKTQGEEEKEEEDDDDEEEEESQGEDESDHGDYDHNQDFDDDEDDYNQSDGKFEDDILVY